MPQVAAWRRDGTRPKIAVWTTQQLATFLTAVADDDLYGLWWLAGLRGLRRGELVGLRWVDVDLADATLTVTRTLVELPGVVAESEPKTAAGNRTITLDPATVKVLADHRRRQQRMYEDHGTTADETGFVFAWPDGRPIRPGWLTHRFTALVTEHGLPPVRPHDLRHRDRDECTARLGATGATITLRNTGAGIAADGLPRIFRLVLAG